MLPIERLTAEHRLIDRLLAGMRKQVDRLSQEGTVAMDFMRVFADLTHHGKEETILFSWLMEKPISDPVRQVIGELKAEHESIRRRTTLLVAARELHLQGSAEALTKVLDVMVRQGAAVKS